MLRDPGSNPASGDFSIYSFILFISSKVVSNLGVTFNNNINSNAESTTRHKKKKTQKAWHQGRMATVPKIGVEVRSDGHSA